MNVLGIGRLCIDKYYYLLSDVERVQSTKQSIGFVGQRIGGSVPRILSCFVSYGYETTLISNGSFETNENLFALNQLNLLGIKNNLIIKEKLPESFLLYGSGNNFISVLSVIENEQQLLTEEDIDIMAINSLDPTLVITDVRHSKASLVAAKWAKKNNRHIFLDPGSSLMHKIFSASMYSDEIELLRHCTIICSSEEFYKEFCSTGNIKDIFNNDLFSDLQLAICTLSNGVSIIATRDCGFSIARARSIKVCNSLGTGDVYRGFFLSSLIMDIHRTPLRKENLEMAAKMAIASATIQIETSELFNSVPTKEKVDEVLMSLHFNKSETTDFIFGM